MIYLLPRPSNIGSTPGLPPLYVDAHGCRQPRRRLFPCHVRYYSRFHRVELSTTSLNYLIFSLWSWRASSRSDMLAIRQRSPLWSVSCGCVVADMDPHQASSGSSTRAIRSHLSHSHLCEYITDFVISDRAVGVRVHPRREYSNGESKHHRGFHLVRRSLSGGIHYLSARWSATEFAFQECRHLLNHSTMVAIISGLEWTAIRRLHRSWSHVESRVLSQMRLCKAVGANTNHSAYLSTVASFTTPHVPFLGKSTTYCSCTNAAFTPYASIAQDFTSWP